MCRPEPRDFDPLDFLVEQKKQAEGDLLRESKKHRTVRIVETAPGFGAVRAAPVEATPVEGPPYCFSEKHMTVSLGTFNSNTVSRSVFKALIISSTHMACDDVSTRWK